MSKSIYFKVNKGEFNDLVDHLATVGHDGFDAMLGTMHEVAEDGLFHFQDEVSMRTQERSGQLLDSFQLGNSKCVYDVGTNDVVFGSALYYAGMVDSGHAIVPPGYRRDYRRQKRRLQKNQRYDYYEGAHYFNPALDKIKRDFFKRMGEDLGHVVEDTSFVKKKKKRKRKKGAK